MTTTEKIARVKLLLNYDPQATDEVVTGYLDIARDLVLHAMYPLIITIPSEVDVPTKYEGIECELAARKFSRRGGLGEIEHDENGIGRKWASSVDSDLLDQVTPFAKVV